MELHSPQSMRMAESQRCGALRHRSSHLAKQAYSGRVRTMLRSHTGAGMILSRAKANRARNRQIERLRHWRKLAMEAALLLTIGLAWGAVFTYSLFEVL